VRRLALLLAGGAVWLFLAAIPAFADGGPHIASLNNGSGGLTADSCAGCHRAHTAQTDTLLIESETTLCLSCHGSGATGATTNVVSGVQFVPASATDQLHRNPDVILGALRDGGFVNAAIGSGNAEKILTGSPGAHGQPSIAKIPVRVVAGNLTVQPVTSAHLSVPGSPLTGFTETTWGNITNNPSDTSVGATTGTLECTSCHNPHGNGQYRILQTQPAPANSTDFVGNSTPAVVTDAPLPPQDPTTGAFTDTRNYTVIQTSGGTGTLLASQVMTLTGYSDQMGDYLRKQVPWDGSTTVHADAPNGDPATFNTQISEWCTACHTRYLSTSSADTTNTNSIFHNRHQSDPSHGADGDGYVTCTTCHVAHGSNAQMTPNGYSADVNYPGDPPGTASNPGDSRLLKADNRGICQTCHDPTNTVFTVGTVLGGPLPAGIPIVP
jgi:predicted CXXCH cytochrome family protein